jgi:hypothetical protein
MARRLCVGGSSWVASTRSLHGWRRRMLLPAGPCADGVVTPDCRNGRPGVFHRALTDRPVSAAYGPVGYLLQLPRQMVYDQLFERR